MGCAPKRRREGKREKRKWGEMRRKRKRNEKRNEKKKEKQKEGIKQKPKENVERKEREDARGFGSHFLERESVFLLSRIVGDPTVEFLRDKKESCSTRRGQRVDYGFREFLQTP